MSDLREALDALIGSFRPLDNTVDPALVVAAVNALAQSEPRDAVDDPEVLALWRDYRHVTKDGNPLGMTFAAYIAARSEPVTYVSTSTTPTFAPPAPSAWPPEREALEQALDRMQTAWNAIGDGTEQTAQSLYFGIDELERFFARLAGSAEP